LVGARRLRHVSFLDDDPLVLRFAGLGRLPSQSTLGRFLKRFNYKRYTQLEKFSRELAWDSVSQLGFRRLTVDVDGSVLSTGLKVGRAFWGFNPHRRKNPSLATSFQLATIAEPKPRTRKRTASFLLRSIKTLRFEWLVKAARLIRPGGRMVLRLARNEATEAAYTALSSDAA